MDEFAGLDDPDAGSGEAPADVDVVGAEREDAVGRDGADDRAGRVGRLVGGLRRARVGRRDRGVALGRGSVADRLVWALVVVVGAEPVEQRLQFGEALGGRLVCEPLFECS